MTPSGHSLGDLANRLGGRVRGDESTTVHGLATLADAGPGDLTFLANRRYRKQAASTKAAAVLVPPDLEVEGKDLLEVPEPYVALARLLEWFHPPEARDTGVSPDARVGEGAVLGEEVAVGPFAVVEQGARLGDRVTVSAGCYVGKGAEIGDDSLLYPGVVLYPGTSVGMRCILHSGVVLGGDGFGFATTEGRHRKIPQVGKVVVQDDVEIGANSTVDRGALGDTVIGEGTKIDNLVMVAHGVRIGPNCLLVGQAGIAGSTTLGSGVTVAGQSGAAGHLELGDRCIVAAKSAVFEDLPEGSFVAGIPARDHRNWKRSQAIQHRLPEMRSELRALKSRVELLEAAMKNYQEED